MSVRLPFALRCASVAALLTAPLVLAPAAGAAPKAGSALPGDIVVTAPGGDYVSVLTKGDPAAHRELPGARPVVRDLDGDGRKDLAVQRDNEDGGGVAVYWGTGSGYAAKPTLVSGATLDSGLTAGDFDGDGHVDLIAAGPEGPGDVRLTVAYGPLTRAGAPARTAKLNTKETFAPDEIVSGDFNGDGRSDVVTEHSFEEAGHPSQLWTGSAKGLGTTSRELAIAGAMAAGDVDGDGVDDLVIRAVPDGLVEELDFDHGTVQVLYGSETGPGKPVSTITQNTKGVPGVNEDGDAFGASLAVGDVDGDGCADVAVGVPGEALRRGGKNLDDAGSVVLLKGSWKGLTGEGATAVTQDSKGVPGVSEAGDEFGSAVSLRDIAANGRTSLVVGAPGEDTDSKDSGAVWVLPKGATSGAWAVNPGDLGRTGNEEARFGAGFGR
ncbi:FG-GAP-like repeat-containing protein [Streptomyces sp. AM 3-1-1]|uniref:FG-GAP-like repeat-containing protein n=1 Tax=Streptomyces sp. AM 3-1-1 TaxID=3028711 RepID=UPI0023B893A9|nr:FG-GAP-like repeat-containing protein [Streptomyces sp. AM 3-1-1]WEH27836.1 FG-GAP-like repeat-containing protein [Streptomyces sp. AM 3-1-1]